MRNRRPKVLLSRNKCFGFRLDLALWAKGPVIFDNASIDGFKGRIDPELMCHVVPAIGK